MANLSRQYVSLNQQYNISAEYNRVGDKAYRELESTSKQLQSDLSRSQQECQDIRRFLDSERGRLDSRFDHILDTTRMLAQSLHSSFLDKPTYSEEQRQELEAECKALKAVLAKERGLHSLPPLGRLQGRTPRW